MIFNQHRPPLDNTTARKMPEHTAPVSPILLNSFVGVAVRVSRLQPLLGCEQDLTLALHPHGVANFFTAGTEAGLQLHDLTELALLGVVLSVHRVAEELRGYADVRIAAGAEILDLIFLAGEEVYQPTFHLAFIGLRQVVALGRLDRIGEFQRIIVWEVRVAFLKVLEI